MPRLLPAGSEVLPILTRLTGFAGVFFALLVVFAALVGDGTASLAVEGTAMFVVALAATVIVLRFDGRRSLNVIGLPWSGFAREIGWGLVLGIAFVVPAVVIAVGVGGLRYGPDAGTWIEYGGTGLWAALILLVAATGEEILVRGYPLRVLADRWGRGAALVLTSLMFAVLHGANPNVGVLALANIVLAGFLLGLICLKTGSLWVASGVHMGWNLGTGFLADLPVSGLEIVDAPLIEVTRAGSPLVTGGQFGVEAGLAATVAMVIAILVVVRTEIPRSRWSRYLAISAGASAAAPSSPDVSERPAQAT